MKNKHNKKRNTAFVFESLIREMSKSIISKDKQKKQTVTSILREYFSKGKILEKELQCYQALLSEEKMDKYTAEKMIHHAKMSRDKLDSQELFQEQSKMIKRINQDLGPSMFSNFIPNYKDFATIAQIFSDKTPVGKKVILENNILNHLTQEPEVKNDTSLQNVNSLVVKSFAEKFNKTYKSLLPEQKNLLAGFVQSFSDSGADFRIAVGSELKRIHEAVKQSLELSEISSDQDMIESTKKVLSKIESLNVSMIDEKKLKSILKLQQLVREYDTDAVED